MNRLIHSFNLETGAELLKAFRAPDFILPTLGMPVAFYSLFAIMLPGSSNNPDYLLATYGVFAVMAPAIFGFGISVANERDKGWLDLKLAAPSQGFSYIGAKVFSTLLFSSISLAIMYMVAGFAAGVALPQNTWALLLITHITATFPFILIGLIIGFVCNANASIAISNIIFLAFAALGGLWIPIMMFPQSMQTFAQFLPTYHLSEIALYVLGAPGERNVFYHIIVVTFMSLVLLITTVWAWSKQRNH
ncbi:MULTISPECIES: ABC transporter permease [Aliiglaciecola]|uniref:ABC transporter permease n=1 Tax=Aliiglaciecola TaxID=1406885 RepID=UPI0020912182|nr:MULTISPECIES: ABC transporter permease [Aliiglaciecola]MDO6713115.1 ABC transporter permease [Aliiglaciecola sp. 2_MG-2023]MDO6754119.1 ABC transporter permease [Aliiglaciecola sp. 1_MG-2023]